MIRTVGRVEVDERRLEHVHIKLKGWIEKMYIRFEGEEVKKGQKMFEIYSPNLVSTQEEYLLALESMRKLGTSKFPEVAEGARSLLKATRRRFEFWDIRENHIEELEQTGEILRTLPLHAPISGYVETINVREGMYVTPDLDIYTLADLSTVWVLADMYEYEIADVEIGQEAKITLPYYQGQVFHGEGHLYLPRARSQNPNRQGPLRISESGLEAQTRDVRQCGVDDSAGKAAGRAGNRRHGLGHRATRLPLP